MRKVIDCQCLVIIRIALEYTQTGSNVVPILSVLTKDSNSGIIVKRYKIPVNRERDNPTAFNGTNISKLIEKK